MAGSYYPVALDLDGRPCLVVGGGALAAEKVEGLLRAGANVMSVAPRFVPALEALARVGQIAVQRRAYEPADVEGIWLAYGADEDVALNARVAADARAAGALVNAVDDIPNCDFYAVAQIRRGDLQVAISTNGKSPAFARWMREYLDSWLPDELGDLLDVLADVRRELKAGGAVPPYPRWQAAITDEVLLALRHGERETARARVHTALTERVASAPELVWVGPS